jgi:hypothetical protein
MLAQLVGEARLFLPRKTEQYLWQIGRRHGSFVKG